MSEEKQMPVVAMDSLEDDDIFYSDDESSDSEDALSTNWNTTDYLESNNLFYNKNELQVDAKSCTNFFNKNAINKIVNPVDQISTGMKNLLNEVASSRPMPSYSAITRKSPTSDPPQSVKPPTIKPRPKSTSPVTTPSTASTPYRFVSKNPVADPRYPACQQLMLGPIPGHLDHDNIYNSLRGFFQTKGPVQFMFIHKGAVKIQSSGDKTVKFGYVVFAKKGPAQAILKEGAVTFAGHSIKVKSMEK